MRFNPLREERKPALHTMRGASALFSSALTPRSILSPTGKIYATCVTLTALIFPRFFLAFFTSALFNLALCFKCILLLSLREHN
jgi:hypothetical protein